MRQLGQFPDAFMLKSFFCSFVVCLTGLLPQGLAALGPGPAADADRIRPAGIPQQSSSSTNRIRARRAPLNPSVASSRAKAFEWADQTRKSIAPALHPIETEHFLIFSAWHRSQDAGLARVCEDMYAKLRAQFHIAPGTPTWPGKLPIFIFWDKDHFRRFSAEIDKSEARHGNPESLNGYHSSNGYFSYVVISGVMDEKHTPAEATLTFYRVLVHEGTHAFMNQWITRRRLPTWLEEGVADYMAMILVPVPNSRPRYLEATRRALEGSPETVLEIFDKKHLKPMEYGFAQSLAQYLMALNGQSFVRFIQSIKHGTPETVALKQTFGLSHETLVRNWLNYARTQPPRP